MRHALKSEGFVGWEEVVVSNDKGRREVHYYLKTSGGEAELAVVGREKSARHMAYHASPRCVGLLVSRQNSETSCSPSSLPPAVGSSLRLKSRREVIDWLSSLVSDLNSDEPSLTIDRLYNNDDTESEQAYASQGLASLQPCKHSTDFAWLGVAWHCRKRRKHYRSFRRNDITISVHDFIYVTAEDCKRLVAYVEDLYEDMRANKRVLVRWFHEVDAVATVLPPDVNDREIFFSLCLQDFSVECVDSLAAVLSFQHFEKFQNELKHSVWEPFMCRRQIDNDDVKPFDITQVQGYWSQELLRSMYSSSLKLKLKISPGSIASPAQDRNNTSNLQVSASSDFGVPMQKKGTLDQQVCHFPSPGSLVEVLSQDSGLRGCWFRCMVLKRSQEKVKVKYQDLLNAEETGNLEEWISAKRIAADDKLLIRISGRPMVRPALLSNVGNSREGRFDVGSVIDAWWHDGWWEGIVISKESEQKICVYLTGEGQFLYFCNTDLRSSPDWACNRWNSIKDRPDIASSLLPSLVSEGGQIKLKEGSEVGVAPYSSIARPEDGNWHSFILTEKTKTNTAVRALGGPLIHLEAAVVPDLAKHFTFDGLRWRTSKKRQLRGERCDLARKRHFDGSTSSNSQDEDGFSPRGPLMLPRDDEETCKGWGSDPGFSSDPASGLQSLLPR